MKARALTLFFLWISLTIACVQAAEELDESETSTGTWRWSFTMPDGSTVEPRVKLKQEGEMLTGTTRFRDGADIAISQGKVEGNEISFLVKRERNGQKVTTLYKGIRSGDRIKGTIETDWSGEKQSYPWQARRSSRDPAGTWGWKLANRRGETNQFMLELKHEGEKLTGTFTAFGVDTEIEDGQFKGGEVSFTVARETGDDVIVSAYRGKIAADVIHGRVFITGGERDRLIEWQAKRAD